MSRYDQSSWRQRSIAFGRGVKDIPRPRTREEQAAMPARRTQPHSRSKRPITLPRVSIQQEEDGE